MASVVGTESAGRRASTSRAVLQSCRGRRASLLADQSRLPNLRGIYRLHLPAMGFPWRLGCGPRFGHGFCASPCLHFGDGFIPVEASMQLGSCNMRVFLFFLCPRVCARDSLRRRRRRRLHDGLAASRGPLHGNVSWVQLGLGIITSISSAEEG